MERALYISIIVALLTYSTQTLWFIGTDMVIMYTEDTNVECEGPNDIPL